MLGDGVVITVEPGYRIEPGDDAVDAVRFEGLVDRSRRVPPSQAIAVLDQALGLWHGPAYGEFADEWWALPHATRLDELRLVATEERIDALLAVGDCSRAVADLEALIPAHPLRERLVAQLMRAYDAEGRQAEALRTFQDHRERLADQTGLDPGATLTTLERSIILGTEPAPAGVDRTLRGYVLGDVLGEGAFGTVYRSVQPGVDREVAVKVIRADRADDPAFVQRFEAEAQLVARLEHPHIVPLYDFWREPGGAYLVFRLLRGGSARDALLAEGAWSLERVSRLVDEVGGGAGGCARGGRRAPRRQAVEHPVRRIGQLLPRRLRHRDRSPARPRAARPPPAPAPRSTRRPRRSGTTRPHRRPISTASRSSCTSS